MPAAEEGGATAERAEPRARRKREIWRVMYREREAGRRSWATRGGREVEGREKVVTRRVMRGG